VSALPAPIDRKTFEAPRRDFEALEKLLRAIIASPNPITQTEANQAQDFDNRARAFLNEKNPESPEAKIGPHRDKAYQTWKGLVAWVQNEERPARIIHGDPTKRIRGLAPQIAARYERERQAKIAQQRRDDETRQLAEQTRNQAANAEHLLAIAAETNDEGALQAAIDEEQRPLAPIVSSVDPDAGKVPDSSVTFKKTALVNDAYAFVVSLAKLPRESIADLVKVKVNREKPGPVLEVLQSDLDDWLNRNKPALDGLAMDTKDITRNTSRA